MKEGRRQSASPAVVAFAVVAREGVVDALAGAGVLLAALGRASAAEVERIGKDAQETDQAVQLAHPVLRATPTKPFRKPLKHLEPYQGIWDQAVHLPHTILCAAPAKLLSNSPALLQTVERCLSSHQRRRSANDTAESAPPPCLRCRCRWALPPVQHVFAWATSTRRGELHCHI